MLKYLRHNVYWKSILTTAKQENYNDYDLLKTVITKYFYQSWIAGGTSNRIKQTAFNILKLVKENTNIDDIKNLIIKNLNKYPNYMIFLNGEDVYYDRWLKPLLLSIEYYKNEKKDFIPIQRDLQVEHILPQSWNSKHSWNGEKLVWKKYFNKQEANEVLNSLGNLTLLSGKKNIEASNCNFDKKIDIYKGNSGKGFDGKVSFEITKSIIDDYKTWTKEDIEDRYENLIEDIKVIFEI